MFLDNELGSSKKEIWEVCKTRHDDTKLTDFVKTLDRLVTDKKVISKSDGKLYRLKKNFYQQTLKV